MALLDTLTADVAAETTIDASVETLLTGLIDKLNAIGSVSNDPATVKAIKALTDQMESNATALGAAVAQGTSALGSGTGSAGVPVVTGLSPNSAVAGSSLSITGTGFTGATGVFFGGVVTTNFSFGDDTSINRVGIPPGTGTVDVSVVTPAGTSVPVKFTYSA